MMCYNLNRRFMHVSTRLESSPLFSKHQSHVYMMDKTQCMYRVSEYTLYTHRLATLCKCQTKQMPRRSYQLPS